MISKIVDQFDFELPVQKHGKFALLLTLGIGVLLMMGDVGAATDVSGTITSDTTWTLSHSPYIVVGSVIVNSGVTLLVEPGVVVKFNSLKAIQIDGTIIARGTTGNPIIFTSNKISPIMGDWGYIFFNDSSADATYDANGNFISGSILEYCIIEYAGWSDNGAVRINNAQPLLNYCTIRNNRGSGINTHNIDGNLKVANSNINNNTGDGINGMGENLGSYPGVLISNSTFNDNKGYGIVMNGNWPVTIENTSVLRNTIGGINSPGPGGDYAISNCHVNDNSGTGIQVIRGTVAIRNCIVTNNMAYRGAGLILYYVTGTIGNSSISNNTANAYFGGMWIAGSSISISNSTISHNFALGQGGWTGNGGGIHIDVGGPGESDVTIVNSRIHDNYATGDGGGIATSKYYGGSVTLTIEKSFIANNMALGIGSGIYAMGVININNNTIINNSAFDYPALFVSGNGGSINHNTFINNHKLNAAPSSAVYIDGNPSFNYNNLYDRIAYDLFNGNTQGSADLNARSNWWGTTSDSAIQSRIYDWFDDSSKGIVDYSQYLSKPDITAPISSPVDLTAVGGDSVINLNWSANHETDLAGYKVYYDTNSGYPYEGTGANEGKSGIDVGNVGNYQLSGLIKGIKYYVAITAYDTSGDESWYSQVCATPKVGAIYVPDYHRKIQDAVNNACSGDIIIVRDGTYVENVDVNNRNLTIRSENGSAKTIVQAENPGDSVLEVTTDYINISGFTLTGGNGIRLDGSSNNTISKNIFLNGGIVLYNSKNNLLLNNEISGTSWDGIVLSYSTSNRISNNTIKDKSGSGFFIDHSFNNIIKHNIIENNGRAGSDHSGIGIDYSELNIISDNNISNNGFSGIRFLNSNYNNITNNLIENHNYGIYWRSGDQGNTIYLNHFMSNSINNGGIDTDNSWNSPQPMTYTYNGSEYISKLGNYWSDYSGSDLDGNGIGDTAYSISRNNDNYPLMRLSEAYTFVPSTIELLMNETASSTDSLFETIISQNATLNTSVKGDFNGTLNFTDLEFVFINSGYFSGKGFYKSNWFAEIEGNSYKGYWQGMLFKKPEERKIYLKGMVSGHLKGIMEGYLIESVNGSNVYDQYQAKWTINQIGADIVYAKLDLDGSANYYESSEYSSELYALQSSIEGDASGYYNGSLNIVLTHVRIDNETKPYYGQGFSIMSYVSKHGAGEGWTYDELVSPGIVEMNGLFDSPLLGIVYGTLDETVTPRSISFIMERIDIGLTPVPDLKVKVWGPERVSPGQTVDYIIEYRNDGLKAAKNMSLIFFPSLLTYYISASSNGSYDDLIHTVRWDFAEIPSKSINKIYYKSNVMWGLQQGESLGFDTYLFPYQKANNILQHNTPPLDDTSRKANNYIENIIEGFLTGLFSQAPPGVGESVGIIQLGPPGIYTASVIWAKAMMEKMSAENAFHYWNEVLDLLNKINNNPTYIKDNYPDETFHSLVEKLAKKYGIQSSMPNINDDSEFQSAITIARDPNIKYGPEGFVLPGQELNYTVEFENEGEGIAFGVYFTDTLDKGLDASTLEIGPVISTKDGSIMARAGIYNPSTRTITWLVGEVGPNEGGYSNLNVNVKGEVGEGTEIINYATVYFPSVPETTRTNGVVSIIDITPPGYSNLNQKKSAVNNGETNEVYAYWQDGLQLNYTWLETNESGTWQNISSWKLSGNEAWGNFSLQTTREGVACWRLHTNDTAGNENSTSMLCFEVHPSLDKIPPLSITYPKLDAAGQTWLNFTWLNPPDPDFSHVMLYLNGYFKINILAPQNYYNFTGLDPDTLYEFGTHTFDSSGNVNETWINATARTLPSGAVPPVAVCGADKFKCESVGAPVQFNGSASYGTDGAVLSYFWDFGDSANGTGEAPKHAYATYKWNGTAYEPFIVNLTVTDDSGLIDSTSQYVTIWIAGDANGDGKVNILDAAVVGMKWGSSDPCADLNNDGVVNILDASIIGLNWGKSA